MAFHINVSDNYTVYIVLQYTTAINDINWKIEVRVLAVAK